MNEFIERALKEFGLSEMPMAGDPRREEIQVRVFELTKAARKAPEKRVIQERIGEA